MHLSVSLGACHLSCSQRQVSLSVRRRVHTLTRRTTAADADARFPCRALPAAAKPATAASLQHKQHTSSHCRSSATAHVTALLGPQGVCHSHALINCLLPAHCRWETSASPSSTHRNKDGVSINSAFDSGNIEVRCFRGSCAVVSSV
jgi:hypothetical protein